MPGLLSVPLFPDEILSSYLSRLANANGSDSAMNFCRDLGVQYKRVKSGDATSIDKLAAVVGESAERLHHQNEIVTANHSIKLFGQRLTKPQATKNRFRYCPDCFDEDDRDSKRMPGTGRYRRSHWLVTQYRRCTEHDREIVEMTPHPIHADFHELLANVDSVIAATPSSPRSAASFADRFIQGCLSGKMVNGPLLDGLGLDEALYFAQAFGIALVHGRDQQPSALKIDAKHEALTIGLEVLAQGDNAYLNALDTISRRSPGGPQRGMNTYGRFFANLFRRLARPEMQTIRDLTYRHATATTTLSGVGFEQGASLLTLEGAAKVLGRSRDFVKTRLKSSENPIRTDSLVQTEFVLRLKDSLVGNIQSKKAREILGCDTDLFDDLVDAKIVVRATPRKVLHGQGRPRAANAVFDESDVRQLREAILAACGSRVVADMVTVRRFSRLSGRSSAQIIGDILAGRQKAARSAVGGQLVDIIHVPTGPKRSDRYLNATEAAKALDLDSGTLSKLLKLGYIQCRVEQTAAQRFPLKLIAKEDIEAFKSRYVSIGQLKNSTGIARNVLSQRMRMVGIEPAFPSLKVGATLIKRNEADRLLSSLKAE